MNLNVMLFCVFLWLVLLELAGKRLQKQIKSFFFFFFCILIKSEAFNQTNRRMRKKNYYHLEPEPKPNQCILIWTDWMNERTNETKPARIRSRVNEYVNSSSTRCIGRSFRFIIRFGAWKWRERIQSEKFKLE